MYDCKRITYLVNSNPTTPKKLLMGNGKIHSNSRGSSTCRQRLKNNRMDPINKSTEFDRGTFGGLRTNGNHKPYYQTFHVNPQRTRLSPIKRSLNKEGWQNRARSEDTEEKGCGAMCLCGKHHSPNLDIKYKYPKNIRSLYQKDFQHFQFPERTEIYIHEKNKKHLSPHKMDLKTTKQLDFKAPNLELYKLDKKRPTTGAPLPFNGKSSYAVDFPNWGTNHQVFEKRPQYPVRTLPFNGASTYSQVFSQKSPEESVKNAPINYLWQTPAPFDHKSTTMVDFQPKTGDRFPCFKPKPQVPETYSFPGQFLTTSQREFHLKFEANDCKSHPAVLGQQLYFDPTTTKCIYQ